MLHVLAHPMEEIRSTASWALTPYTKKLKNVASHLTAENLSALKLIVQSENYLKKQTLDELKNPHEFFRVLQGRSLISNKDTSFLSFLLREIERNDLAKMLENVEVDLCLDGPAQKCPNDPGDSPHLSQMSVDEIEDYDDNEIIMSSQSSISDEEKLLHKKKVPDSM